VAVCPISVLNQSVINVATRDISKMWTHTAYLFVFSALLGLGKVPAQDQPELPRNIAVQLTNLDTALRAQVPSVQAKVWTQMAEILRMPYPT
jgi:hypothetical protein